MSGHARAPGYYPDPQTGNSIRYWDGTRWAEDHHGGSPAGSTAGHGSYPAAPSTVGIGTDPTVNPYLGALDPRTPAQPVTGSGYQAWQPASAPATSPTVPSYGSPPQAAPTWGTSAAYPPAGGYAGPPGQQQPTSPRRRGMGAAIAIVVTLLVLGGVWYGVRVSQRPPEPVGVVEVDEPLDGSVPAGGSWPVALTITDPGVVSITALSDEDLTLKVYDTDSPIAENDDGESMLGGDSLDPELVMYLEPGEYVVVVDTYDDDDDAADAELHIRAEDAVELGDGSSATPITVPAGGYWIGYATFDPPAPVAVDVRSVTGEDDLQMVVGTDDGNEENDDRESDDPPAGEYDPYLEVGETGYVIVLVAPWGSGGDAAIDATVTLLAG